MDPDLKVLDPRKLLKKNGCMEKVKMKTNLERLRTNLDILGLKFVDAHNAKEFPFSNESQIKPHYSVMRYIFLDSLYLVATTDLCCENIPIMNTSYLPETLNDSLANYYEY